MTQTLTLPKIPAFRFGDHYDSLTRVEIRTLDGAEVLASVGHVNAGVIRRDLRQVQTCFEILQQVSVQEMLTICKKAAKHFLEATLPVSEDVTQAPDDYVRLLSATCGLPHALIRANMQKIADVMVEMSTILKGLTRGLDPAILETGLGEHLGIPMSYFPNTTHLGLVLPSNSPGVNSLWLPALVLRIPVILKPGREDPWTPWRIINALLAAGCPAEAFGFYPTDHEGASVILSECQRVILFGDARTVEKHAGDPRISAHGPGYSKILIGDDRIDAWPDYIDVIADSVARNGGRSCVNASTLVVPRHGQAIARALAKRLATIRPQALDAPDAQLAGFANVNVPAALDQRITQALARGGAVDVSVDQRSGERCIELNGQTYMQPTVVYCEEAEHALANTEFLFPFVSVVEIPQARMLQWIGPSLVVTVITEDADFKQAVLRCAQIKRLNLGPMTTAQVSWDQPHEGNLFEFLYERRAIGEMRA
jgi:acyl-CoA reductase-like NAD-dependent aldehyde dehydrogenase